MRRLLKIEFIKVKSYRAFWAIMSIYAMIFILITSFFGMADSSNPAHSYFGFPGVWLRLSNVASYLNILPGILIIMLLANEYSFRTFRQNLIDGMSRKELVYAKFILIGGIAFLCISFVFLWGLTRGMLTGHFDTLSDIYRKSPVLINLFIQAAGFMSVAALITFVFKKAAFSILVYLVYIVAIEPIIWWKTADEIDRFFPMNIFWGLLPDSDSISLQGMFETSALSPEWTVVVALLYILGFFGASLALMEKSNL